MRKLFIFAFAVISGIILVNPVANAQREDRGEMKQRQMRASDILGETLYTQDNQEIGEIQKIFIDRQQGDISSISVDVSDFMQTDKNLCKIPWDRVSMDRGNLVVNMDARRVERMCPLRTRKGRGLFDQGQYQEEYDQRRYQMNPRYEDEMGIEFEEDQQMQQRPQSPVDDVSASRLLGEQIYNTQDEEVGEIEEVLIDRRTGEVTGVVVGTGGFLGIGENSCRIDWNSLSSEGGDLILNMQEDPNAACRYGQEWSEDEYSSEYGIGIE
ncbi:MAG: PRC-barrel domain-containing protein [Candidatus Omnitrophota bacterium]